MEVKKSLVVFAIFIIGGPLKVDSWNVDANRLQVLRSGPEVQNDEHVPSFLKLNNHRTRAADYYSRYRNPRYQHHNAPRKLQPRSRVYRPLEDPSSFYRKLMENSTQNDGNSKMMMRQRGSVTLPYRGGTAIARPNSTTIVQHKQNRRGRYFRNNEIEDERHENICIKCPGERTVVAKKGRGKVFLQTPELRDCWGGPVPVDVQFKRIYGPKFGSLLAAGSHITVAHVVSHNQTLQLCQYRVNVIVQTCPALQVSSDVLEHCPNGYVWGASCYFRCLKHNGKLNGNQRITCTHDLTWTSDPPACESNNWCDPPTAPDNGRLDCNTPNIDNENDVTNSTFPEGTVCKAQCNAHFVPRPKIAKCLIGSWTTVPACRRRLHRRRRRHPQKQRVSHKP